MMKNLKKAIVLTTLLCVSSCSNTEDSSNKLITSSSKAEYVPVSTIDEFVNKYSAIKQMHPSDDSMFVYRETEEEDRKKPILFDAFGENLHFSPEPFFYLAKAEHTFEAFSKYDTVGYELWGILSKNIGYGEEGDHIIIPNSSVRIEIELKTYAALCNQREYFIDIIARSNEDNRITEIGTFAFYSDPDYYPVQVAEGQIYQNWNGAYVSDYTIPQVAGQNQLVNIEDVMSVFEITHKENEGKYCKKNQ